MKSLIKTTLNSGSTFASLLLTFSVFSHGAIAMSIPSYSFTFKTNKSTCLLRINDLPIIDNTDIYSGTMSAGYNITPSLENGLNHIKLLMGPQNYEDPKTLFADSSCEVTIYRKENDTESTVANYKLIVGDDGKILSQSVSSVESKTANLREGYSNDEGDYGLYKVSDNFSVNGIPAWQWTKARPVTEKDINEIKMAYARIAGFINIKDINEIKKSAKISNDEIALSQNVSPDFIFQSTGLAGLVKNYTVAPIDWDEFELIKYRDGKLFRLGVGFNQISPLQFMNAQGKLMSSYNPYFSIINGKVVQVR